MPETLPAVSLAAVPGRRRASLELAQEIERRGFSGIYCPSVASNMALAEALALVTEHIAFGTAIAPIYARHVSDFAQSAAFINEVSGGRFRFGIGVSHGPTLERLGVKPGKPLGDVRRFVEDYRAAPQTGDKPPVLLAALRRKMIALAGEIGDGMLFANGARSHMAESLAALPAARRADAGFTIGCMTPTCISDDLEAAKAVNRRTLTRYAMLPNYRNYWKEAGYREEMEGVERAVAAGEPDRVPHFLTDRWLADVTLFGTPTQIRDALQAWYEAGINTPILVPSSATGNQLQAFQELFETFAR